MGFTAFIDVAIGLIVVYLGASLMVTVFNEWLSQYRGWRKQVLAKSLAKLFNQPGLAAALPQLPGLTLLDGLIKTQGSRSDTNLLARGVAAALTGGNGKASLNGIREGLSHLPDSQAKQVLTTLAATCADDLERFFREAGVWIDHALHDLGQAYRNWMQVVSFMLGLITAIAFNIDTLHLVNRLYSDKAMRDQAVATAEGLVSSAKPEQLQGCAKEWATNPGAVSKDCTQVARLLDSSTARQQPAVAALPIGWGEGKRPPNDMALSVIGWLITAVAISFGAPFWFDLLSKLLSLRRSVVPSAAAKSQDQGQDG
ncbi:MAG TPA: hypothetical protein VI279_15080 [Rhodocyclaceae bacterium]